MKFLGLFLLNSFFAEVQLKLKLLLAVEHVMLNTKTRKVIVCAYVEEGVLMFDDILKYKKWPLWKRILYLILMALPLPIK